MGGNDGEIYKTTTACADETGIEIVKVREKDVEGRCYQEAYMHAFLWCSKNFAPELLLVGESEHNIYICMKRMEKTLCDWIPTRKVGMIADVLIKFFQTLDSLHKEYGFVHGDMHGENIMLRDNKAVLIDMGFSCRQKGELIAPCTYDLHGDPTPHDDTMFLLERLVEDARGPSEWLWFLLDIEERIDNRENFDPGKIIISLAQLKNHQYLLDLRKKWDMSDRESESESESDSVSSGAQIFSTPPARVSRGSDFHTVSIDGQPFRL
jgi:serine/threonine protein kinase